MEAVGTWWCVSGCGVVAMNTRCGEVVVISEAVLGLVAMCSTVECRIQDFFSSVFQSVVLSFRFEAVVCCVMIVYHCLEGSDPVCFLCCKQWCIFIVFR